MWNRHPFFVVYALTEPGIKPRSSRLDTLPLDNLQIQLPVFFCLQVIAPEEIVDPNVDEHSVMTYLSQFPKSKLKPGAPLRAKTLHPKRAKAFGPGRQEHICQQAAKVSAGALAKG